MSSLLDQITEDLQNLSESPALDAQVLLAHITQKPRTWILAHPELSLSSTQTESLEVALNQLQKNSPLPYVIGHWEFFGLDFIISSDVLIPRPETEELIEHALKWLHDKKEMTVLDVGTGSGCIPISLAKHAPDLNLLGVDLSSSALDIARQNVEQYANRQGAENAKDTSSSPRRTWRIGSSKIRFIQSDLLANLPTRQPFNLITANLPYIPTEILSHLDVYQREPTLALDGGTDGLDLIHRLLEDAPRYIAPEGLILLEIDSSHGEAALELAKKFFPEAESNLIQDLSGRDRFISIQT